MGAQEAAALVGQWRDRRYGGRYEGYGQQGWGSPTVQAPQQVVSPQWGGQHRHHRRARWEREHPGGDWADHERRRLEWERWNPGQPFMGRDIALIAGTLAAAGIGPEPRAWLRDMEDPTMANRQVLPMNTGTTNVPQSLTANITSRPQRVAFRPERVFVSAADIGGSGSAANWIVNDITIGNRSQFAQSGALPGDMFANVSIDSFVTFETAQTAMDVTMIVTYQGGTYGGTPFFGSIIGTAAV